MTKRLIIVLLALLIAAPALASNRNCTSALVTGGLCRDVGNWLIYYDAPTAALADLRDAILDEYNYQTEIICASSRQFEPLLNGQSSKILNAAGATTDSCTVGQVTANPQGTTDYADAVIDYEMRNRVIQWKINEAQEVANDPTTIETPDTGAP